MKYLYRWLYTSVFLLMLALPQWVGAQTLRPEQITRFDVVATINKDRRITVEETIEYDFGSQFRHGIYRYIPTGYDRNGGRYYLLLDLVSVTQDGNKAIYTKTKNPNETNLKIGEGDKTITGKHTYVIRYNVNRALNDFPDEDVVEWYWNVTGNGWNVPILSSSLTMRGPAEAVDSTCFTGVYGSTQKACSITKTGDVYETRLTKPLSAREGLTVAFRFPLDSVLPVSTGDKILFWIVDNAWAATPFIVFFIMYGIWWFKGRDPKGRGTIIAQYEEPHKLNVLQMSGLLDESVTSRAVTAALLDLARRGYMHVEYEGEKNKKMFLIKDREADAGMNDAERALFDGVFSEGSRVDTDKRVDDLYIAVSKARELTVKQLVNDGYYDKRPGIVRGLWYTAAFAVPVIMMMTLTAFLGSLMIVSSIISGIIMMFFAHYMPRVTRKGAIVREEIKGFKTFLSVTEEKRLAFTDAPEKKPEQFARFLPAAVLFGVEKKWANQFKDMQVPSPEYVQGYNNFNVGSFVNTVHAMESDMSSSYAAPSSSGSGGSGFSGGGSGGGGGGGGGGSW
ncbi:MAG: DUF2207 domain-containing protein [Candidatus Magasanikbacteria bacterium]|nr:DUF2207 domain-containing protein [Candidatus Magasanikbacteria bacterium]HPF95251.1 DUF2207 domain-containing protein [bacterium]